MEIVIVVVAWYSLGLLFLYKVIEGNITQLSTLDYVAGFLVVNLGPFLWIDYLSNGVAWLLRKIT